MLFAEVFDRAQDGHAARRRSWGDNRRVFFVAAADWELRRLHPSTADAILNGFMALQIPAGARSAITPFEPTDADRLADDWELV